MHTVTIPQINESLKSLSDDKLVVGRSRYTAENKTKLVYTPIAT